MNAKNRALLDEAARLMVEEAQAAGSDRIFSATGFAREHISIVHQQLRCVNLAWALGHTKRISRGDVVAIIGGSFSALMLAVSIAIADGAIVYLFEKEKRLLNRFLDKGHRHLSPNLNSRYLGKRFDPAWSSPFFEPPIFRWKRGIASSVAHEWLNEFERYQRKLPIFTFLDWEVRKSQIKRRPDGLTIDLRSRTRPHIRPINVDILIDATGFGDEGNPHALADFSYWEAGHRLIYDNLPKPCEVLVSGCGDSGLIEAMHYAISGFHHGLVENFWPYGANLEATLDVGLEDAKLDDILRSVEVERYGGRVISEVCWWLDTWFRLENWKGAGWLLRSAGAHNEPIFKTIEKVLRPYLKAAFPRRDLTRLAWDEREAFVTKLPLKVQLQAREAIRPLADAWISRGIAALADTINVGKLLRVRKLHGRARPGVTVTLNGTTPTPYTRQLSTYNVWLMRVLTSFPNVRYRQGKISKIDIDRRGRFRVSFGGGTKQVYDRVITRYGPAVAEKHQTLTRRRSRDPHAGSWLLTPVSYTVPTKEKNIHRRITPAIDRVGSKLRELEMRRESPRAAKLNKRMYENTLLLMPIENHPIYCDPQTWLSARLRKGESPSYIALDLTRRFWNF
jgi:hypothetical protein